MFSLTQSHNYYKHKALIYLRYEVNFNVPHRELNVNSFLYMLTIAFIMISSNLHIDTWLRKYIHMQYSYKIIISFLSYIRKDTVSGVLPS